MRALATLIAALLVFVTGGPRALADAGDKVTLRATMSAEEEVPKPGPPGGKGTGTFIIDADEGEVCYDISYSGIERPTAGRIHQGARGANGPVAVDLDLATKGNKGCVTGADEQVLVAMAENPDGYYVNLSTPDYPDGAVRGQLSRAS
jgi:hypothetical protein